MSTYAIGDLQGCCTVLQNLLSHISYNPKVDHLWFCGDLVNRGPESLETLRFVRTLPNTRIVLGNHDITLALLALGWINHVDLHDHTLDAVLAAPDCMELIDWLLTLPFMVTDHQLGYVMVHAGIPPCWTLAQAQIWSDKLQELLRGPHKDHILAQSYGNYPDVYSDNLNVVDQFRFAVNSFTRLRYLTPDGALELERKGSLTPENKHLAWFAHPNRQHDPYPILFGHWSALRAESGIPDKIALDAGCVWGEQLKAVRLEDRATFIVPCVPLKHSS